MSMSARRALVSKLPGSHRLVAHAHRREVEVRQARGGGEADGPDALAVVERPVVALVAVDHLGRAVLELRRHPSHPGVGRLVDVRVAVEDRVVDRRVVVEEVARVLHSPTVSLPPEARNPLAARDKNGAVTKIESAWGKYPDYEINLVPCGATARVWHGDVLLAESDSCLRVEETKHVDRLYFPEADVQLGSLRAERPPLHLSVQGRGRLLDAHRERRCRGEPGVDVPPALRRGRGHQGLRRLLPRAGPDRARGAVARYRCARGHHAALPGVGRRERPPRVDRRPRGCTEPLRGPRVSRRDAQRGRGRPDARAGHRRRVEDGAASTRDVGVHDLLEGGRVRPAARPERRGAATRPDVLDGRGARGARRRVAQHRPAAARRRRARRDPWRGGDAVGARTRTKPSRSTCG